MSLFLDFFSGGSLGWGQVVLRGFLRGVLEKAGFWCGDLLVSLWWIASLAREKDAMFVALKTRHGFEIYFPLRCGKASAL
jgi:hypothetical protein